MGIVDHQVAFLDLKFAAVQAKDSDFLSINIFKFNFIFVFVLLLLTTVGTRPGEPRQERVHWGGNLVKDSPANSPDGLNTGLYHRWVAGCATVRSMIACASSLKPQELICLAVLLLKDLLGLLGSIRILDQSLDIDALICLEKDILCCRNLNAFFIRQDDFKLHTAFAVHLTPATSDIQFSTLKLDHPILGCQNLLFRTDEVIAGNVNMLAAETHKGPVIFKVAKNGVAHIRHDIYAVTQVTGIGNPSGSAAAIFINVKLYLHIATGNLKHLTADYVAAM